MPKITVVSTFVVPSLTVNSMLTSVVEQGACDHWLRRVEPIGFANTKADPWWYSPLDSSDEVNGFFNSSVFAFKVALDEPDDDETVAGKVFTHVDLERGFRLMAEKCPQRWKDIIEDNEDAITADVWFQYVVLGDLIYG